MQVWGLKGEERHAPQTCMLMLPPGGLLFY
jgi:hypothetical protein